uniref:RING-type E3 ubiquitin transferase n=1 Tax=Noccaea caerulescens TaxID=107243 RepID=A0A1J3DKP2_NOCCA
MSFRDPNPVTSPPSAYSDPSSFSINSRVMLTAIIVILFVVILMVSLHLYSRWYLLRSRRFHLRRFNRSRRAAAANIFFADPSSTGAVTTRGLDQSVIKSLPVFKFSAAIAENSIECAVCLSEFEESESGRVLPICKHTFHVDCIDMWFQSHSSCPLCRSLVEPIDVGVKSAAVEVAISISDPVPGDDHGSRPELCDADLVFGGAETSGDSNQDDSRRKPALIEVPRRDLGELENDLSGSHSFRSPMRRVISFTRILSRDRRSASSSSVGLPPVSPPAYSMSVTEIDIELGGEETR